MAKTWLLPGQVLLYQWLDLNETLLALALDGNELHDKVLLGFYQWLDLNETLLALALDGNELHDKVLLGSIQHSQSFCSPSPWPSPCYFLAKNYITSGWILMKLGVSTCSRW